jgi:hypothetical protein
MNKRIERTQEEIQRLMARGGGGGRRGGGGGGGGARAGGVPDNVRYATSPAPPGEYRIVLTVDGRRFERTASIMRDEWWQQR